MKFKETKIPGAYIIEYAPFRDERGSFARLFCKNEFEAAGLCADLCQINLSTNVKKGTLRGLHYQKGDYAEDKLVTCARGSVFDVCVDVREGSPTFGQWVGETLTDENGLALYIPKGCAHGYLTLREDAHVLYFTTQFYTPEADSGYRYDDPAFGIEWPLPKPYIMSGKDGGWGYLK